MSLPLWEECAWYVDIPDEYPEQVKVDEEFLHEEGLEEAELNDDIAIDICSDAGDVPVDEDAIEEGENVEEAIDAADAEESNTHTEDVDHTAETDVAHDGEDAAVHEEGATTESTTAPPRKPLFDDDDAEPVPDEDDEEFAEEDQAEEQEMEDIGIEIVEDEEEIPAPQFKFPISRSINRRIYLYLGEIYKLPCDAIVVGQVENLVDRADGNDVIFTLAGIELEPELHLLAPCTTGDSVVTKGWQMPCEWIIHSVGPKYDERYLNAADHALFSAYKSALLLAAEKEVQSLVIGTIYKQSKNYPRFDAAHVALRTVRKFLEHSVGDGFDRVMFCVNTQEDFEIYSALMHAYFPRSEEELQEQLNLLPIELGDEWGEVIIQDRTVKVSAGPKPLPVESLQQYKAVDENDPEEAAPAGPKKLGVREIKSIGVAPRSMTQADSDPDYERRRKVMAEFAQMTREERLRLRFQAMAQNIDDEDLDDLDALRLIHFLGKDFKERTVVYLSGPNLLRAERMDINRVMLYLIKRMESLRCVPFVLIYGCATLGESYYPDTNFMQSIFDLFACRYKENLMKFYILHASFSFRMYFWLLLPLETTTFWSSYTNLTNLRSLRHYMDIATLDIPLEVQRYDRENYTY